MHYPKFKTEKVNFLLDNGGIGDNIARMPAIKYLVERHPHLDPIVWVADYFFPVARNMLPNVKFKKFSNNQQYNDKLPGRSTGLQVFTNLKTHMVDHSFCLLANEIPLIEYKNYVKLNLDNINVDKFNLLEKYVVITIAYTAPIREFLPEYINEINDYVISKGYNVVFLGQRQTDAGVKGQIITGNIKEEIDFSKGLNLIDQTLLLEAAKIIQGAKTIVGLDNGLIHLAACTGDIPIVCGFTSVDPIHRMPYRNNQLGYNFYPVVPPLDQKERFCQSIWDFTFDHDFRFSYYCNNDLIESVRPELYIEQLEKVL